MNMRYAIFTDIHANLEALEAVLAKIDDIQAEQPVDQIWFLGDLVGYGPDPNECIRVLRERTDVIIAGNHDWAAVGKIDLEDFSPAARISAEWTAKELTEEHREFLVNLPERLEIGECTLVHGSPFGPLWEYLTSEPLAERSFQHFTSRYCLVGHTHVPVIFIQPDLTNTPTIPLTNSDAQARAGVNGANGTLNGVEQGKHNEQSEYSGRLPVESEPQDDDDNDDETVELLIISPATQQVTTSTAASVGSALSAYQDPDSGALLSEEAATAMMEKKHLPEDVAGEPGERGEPGELSDTPIITSAEDEGDEASIEPTDEALVETAGEADMAEQPETAGEAGDDDDEGDSDDVENSEDVEDVEDEEDDETTEVAIVIDGEGVEGTDEQINGEIEELLNLLGLSQSMVQVTNEMLTPPEGHWEAPADYRAIINPGGVGQPRDGDPRAAFMIYDTERGFEFYRIPYDFEKTQEKIIEAGLPQFLAVRLAYGR
jgi:diadenosine tetraphosphatase ApaH/serine/threonine PP2A family protein phosphatase